MSAPALPLSQAMRQALRFYENRQMVLLASRPVPARQPYRTTRHTEAVNRGGLSGAFQALEDVGHGAE
jgi:hypothetical protein